MIGEKYTSEWATDVQKAYKDGYIKGQLDALKQLKDDCAIFYGDYIPKNNRQAYQDVGWCWK